MFKLGDRVKSVRTQDEFDLYGNDDPLTGLNIRIEFGEFGIVSYLFDFNPDLIEVTWDDSGDEFAVYTNEVCYVETD